MKLAIFPGHTGKDSGAIDAAGGAGDSIHTIEAVVTAGIASKLALFCNLTGMDYRLAPGSFDYRVSATRDCTAGISIHADVCADPAVHGFHCLYYPGSVPGQGLARAIDESVSLVYQRARQVHSRRDLAILRDTEFPVVLIECGFLSNTTDEARMVTEEFQYNLAYQVLSGYRDWVYA